ncbi:MAG: tRNA uridine-5-carboxymethylaminomethyl(34) synthesis GTPase MnmE [Chlamydiales bacterium]
MQETIAAIATPPGEGGIAIIRISGDRATEVAEKIFSGPVHSYPSHTAHLGQVVDREGGRIDTALLLLMRAPRSYTGEDTVELQCHGGIITSRKVLEAALAAGARPARPGEFTFRAFLNGKLDLAQAEAVQGLIGAKNEMAFEMASKHLEGALSKKIDAFQSTLFRIAAVMEAWVDFPDENLLFMPRQEWIDELEAIKNKMEKLLFTFHDGRRLYHGIELCIAGAPNVGKSSLMNALVDEERSIVTPIAGTTRDLLQQEMTLSGLHFRITDTAGIRQTEEMIEKEGIRRSKQAMKSADLTLFVIDSTKPLEEEENELLKTFLEEETVIVWNKIDLPEHKIGNLSFPYQVHISAKTRLGIEELKQVIEKMVWKGRALSKDEVVITTLRHKEALSEAIKGLDRVVEGLKEEISPEWLAPDLRGALSSLGKIRGTDITEEILSSIFSQFCIGK